jgi:hypothetical protein
MVVHIMKLIGLMGLEYPRVSYSESNLNSFMRDGIIWLEFNGLDRVLNDI